MEKLANHIAENVAKSTGIDEERKRVIAYGLSALIQMFFLMVVSAIFGLLYHCLIEAMIVFFAVGILKSAAGGAHANTSAGCTVISLVSIFLMALISRFAVPALRDEPIIYFTFVAITYATAFLMAYRLAPVASINKPINRPEKRMRLRRRSFLTIAAYCAISVSLVFFGVQYPRAINASVSLCMATLWQSFMLTDMARRFISSLDSSAKTDG